MGDVGDGVTIRAATPADGPTLARFLVLAGSWRDPAPAPVPLEVLLADDHLAPYVERWGRPGDVGVLVVGPEGRPVGAAWCRTFSRERPGYGFLDEATPELSIAVEPGARGAGLGGRLLRALHGSLGSGGVTSLSLSVEAGNPARRLYERLGYEPVEEAGGATTMRLALAPPAGPSVPGVEPPAPLELTAAQARVLGSLLEKQLSTPDAYPLTLKALTAACNQTSNRDPVVAYQPREVETTVLALKAKGLTRVVHPGSGERATRYRQVLDEVLDLTASDRALLCVLLLRGPQTLSELRTRTERLHGFASPSQVEEALDALAARDRPLVGRVARAPGQKEGRWTSLLEAGAVDRAMAPPAPGRPAPERPPPDADHDVDRVAGLERRVAMLEDQVRSLLDELGATSGGPGPG